MTKYTTPIIINMFKRDFSSFDTMLLYLKLQTCFVLPGLIGANFIKHCTIIMAAEFSIKIIK